MYCGVCVSNSQPPPRAAPGTVGRDRDPPVCHDVQGDIMTAPDRASAPVGCIAVVVVERPRRVMFCGSITTTRHVR